MLSSLVNARQLPVKITTPDGLVKYYPGRREAAEAVGMHEQTMFKILNKTAPPKPEWDVSYIFE